MCSTRRLQQPTVSAWFVLLIAGSESQLVYEVQRHGPLSDPHLLALHVRHVFLPDLINAVLEFPGFLVLLPILIKQVVNIMSQYELNTN